MPTMKLKNAISPFLKPTRRLILESGDPGQLPITKVGGVPWWPIDVERPVCPDGHAMSFIVQIRLSDVPELGSSEKGLLSFHYCQECSYEGNMPWGWINPVFGEADTLDALRFDLTIFTDLIDRVPDGKGIIAEDVESPYMVSFSDRMETPNWDDAQKIHQISRLLKDASEDDIEFMMQDAYDFDEDRFPDLVHIPVSKLGGWPSWVQDPEWPRDHRKEQLIFVGQLSPINDDKETWCNGLAYLFVNPASQKDRKAKLLLQMT